MSTGSRLNDLLRRWEDRRGRGETPTPEEICRDAPDLLVPLRRELEARIAADPRRQETQPLVPRDIDLVDSTAGPAWVAETPLQPGAEPVAGYRLVAPLGRGGFGEVWKAEGPGGFPLALKFVRLAGPVGAAELRSLDVLKRIRHPNLLGTVGAWEVGARLIIAMELADRTLGDRLGEAQGAGHSGIPGPELLEYLREAAKGIDYLNEPRHVIGEKSGVRLQHRDVKPANILLVGTGVKVADFGLVGLLEKSYASHDGALTPAYAAPEFFAGRTSPHSDQYSLAVSYCQLRGGRLPFVGTMAELLNGHVHATPDLTMLPEAERDAVAREMSKRPGDRWPSCRAFVEALARAMEARPPEPASTTRVARPERRPRHVKTSVSLLSAALLVAVALFMPPGKTPLSRPRPTAMPVAIREPSGPTSVAPSRPEAVTSNGLNTPAIPKPHQVVSPGPVRFDGHEGAVRSVTWLPDGKLILSGGDDGVVRSWNPQTGEPSISLTGHEGGVTGLAIAPDGGHLLTGGLDRSVRYWEWPSGRPLWNEAAHDYPVHGVAISPDGMWGLSAGQDMTLRLWDLREERESALIETDVEAYSVAFTSDSRGFLMAGNSPIVQCLQRETCLRVGHFAGHREVVWSVACASRSDLAASGGGDAKGSRDFRIHVWRPSDGRPWRVLEGHKGAVGAVLISPDGRYVLSGGADRTVRLWDCESGLELHGFRGHQANVSCVALSPDGRHAASGGLDGIAFVWTLPPIDD